MGSKTGSEILYDFSIRQNKNIMLDCINALGDYAALQTADNLSMTEAGELRKLVENIVCYWNLGEGENAKSLEKLLNEFDDKVDTARVFGAVEADDYTVCYDILTGLAQHGVDLVGSQGRDAMKEILDVADLLNEIGDYFEYYQETEFANDSARWLRSSVAELLQEYGLPGNAAEGEVNANYAVKQAVLFDNDAGFAFAHNPDAASPYVTWRMFKNSDNKLEYEVGNYFSSEEKALVDYIARYTNYAARFKVSEVPLPVKTEPEQDEWRTYKAEISMPDEEFPHLEVFSAENDVDAVNQAYELGYETKDSYLLEVHELDDDYNSIREIDLRFHDPEARRYMNVDIIDFLGQIADKTIIHYPDDFKIDVDVLWKTAISENPSDKLLMWHCSAYGTHILPEDEVFIRDTGAYGYWVNYRPKEPDIVGFAIEITGYEDEGIIGNVYDVGDYYSHSQYVKENCHIFDIVSLTYANDWGINAGKTITVPRFEYDNDRHRLMSESGRVAAIKYHPYEASMTMADRLKAEKARYMAMPKSDPQEYLEKLDKKLFKLRGEPEQKDILHVYHADFNNFDYNEIITAANDADAIRQANDICAKSAGLALVELNEVYINGNMREVWIALPEPEIMPDPTISVKERDDYGYGYREMLPLNAGRAADLHVQDCEIFLLWKDGTESVVYDTDEIFDHDGIFGIERETWMKSDAYKEMVREAGQKTAPKIANTQAEANKDSALEQEKPEKSKQEKPKQEKSKRKPRGMDR